jgi:hypothetical protein
MIWVVPHECLEDIEPATSCFETGIGADAQRLEIRLSRSEAFLPFRFARFPVSFRKLRKADEQRGEYVFCSVLLRRIKEGVSFENFRKAWEPEAGHFRLPVRTYHARRIDDERKITSFSLIDLDSAELDALGQRITEGEKRRHERITMVIELTTTRGIYEVFAEVGLS